MSSLRKSTGTGEGRTILTEDNLISTEGKLWGNENEVL